MILVPVEVAGNTKNAVERKTDIMEAFILFIKKTLRFLLKPLSFLPAILMVYIILFFSSQNSVDSSEISLGVSKMITLGYNRFWHKQFSNIKLEEIIQIIHPYVRKIAHVTEYFLLAASIALPLYVYKIRGMAMSFIVIAFSVGIAVIDEKNQLLVDGRSGSSRDILIDFIGISLAVVFVRIVGFIGRKTIFSWLSLDKNE